MVSAIKFVDADSASMSLLEKALRSNVRRGGSTSSALTSKRAMNRASIDLSSNAPLAPTSVRCVLILVKHSAVSARLEEPLSHRYWTSTTLIEDRNQRLEDLSEADVKPVRVLSSRIWKSLVIDDMLQCLIV